MTEKIGYVGIVVPERNFWQAYYIIDDFAERAEATLARYRAEPAMVNASTVIERMGMNDAEKAMLDIIAPGYVSTKLRHIPDADQPLLGGLCATMVSAALGEVEHAETIIGVLGYALHTLIQRKYYWIEAKLEPAGTRTTISPIYVSTIDEAREAINSLPVVTKIKRRLVAEHSREGQNRSMVIGTRH